MLYINPASIFENDSTTWKNIRKNPFLCVGKVLSESNGVCKVLVELSDINGYGSTTCECSCVYMDLFGGLGDATKIKPRTGSKSKKDFVGYQVLVLFINGETSNGVILGGYNPDDKLLGDIWYEFTFNGVNFTINKDGEVKIQKNGPTDNVGKPTSSNQNKASITLTKEGNILLDTEKDIILNSSKVKVGSENTKESLVLGNTYRSAESTYHSSMLVALGKLQASIAVLKTVADTGPQIFPTPAGWIKFGAALLTQLPVIFLALSDLVSAITTFEAKTATFLSQSHTTE